MRPPIETYEQAIEFLFGRINYERLHGDLYSSGDFKLERMSHLLERIGNPQNDLPAIHVAGTKGKGSTSAMIAAGLSASGAATGLFTSPHVERFEERMTVDGRQPTRDELTWLVDRLAEIVQNLESEPGRVSPTYFELATALAWQYFVSQHADWAVLEVGLGGRLDATNLCRPAVTLITTISRDHTRLLGSRLEQIAREKAGIIKPGVPMLVGDVGDDVWHTISRIARQHDAPTWRLGREISWRYDESAHAITVTTPLGHWEKIGVPLPGRHQAENTALAAASLDLVIGSHVARPRVAEAIARLSWPVRIETVSYHPTVIVDAAHNWASIAALLETLDQQFPATPGQKRVLVFATSRDKDVDGLLRQLLPRFDTVVLTRFLDNPRAVPVEQLHRRVLELFDMPVHATPDPVSAWHLARHLADPEDLVCVTGSFFIAAELRELIGGCGLEGDATPAPSQPDSINRG